MINILKKLISGKGLNLRQIHDFIDDPDYL